MAPERYDILVARNDLSRTSIEPAPKVALTDDQVAVRIDEFALTANNITYGVAGDSMRYWNFYPARAGMGRIPVWGFATVRESRHGNVTAGERLYGYWPMSTDTVLSIGRASAQSLIETSAHRSDLAAVYNTYVRVSADTSISPGSEPYVSLIRPLFTTSFLIDDFLAANGFFGGGNVLITSASSKTAIGLAHCIRARGSDRPKTIGLTSARHARFVSRLSIYDRVVPYEGIGSLDLPEGAVSIDMAGGATTLSAIHETLGDRLKYSCRVGLTHWQDLDLRRPMPGVKPAFFFAPDRVKARIADWGPQGFVERTGAASRAFVADARRWLELETHKGADAIREAYAKVLKGEAQPDAGIVCAP